jgi:hypothetical protein
MRKHYEKPSNEQVLTILNDKLCEGQIIGVIFAVVNKEVVVDGYRFRHNGEVFVLPYTQNFYKDAEAYKNDTSLPGDCSDLRQAKITGTWRWDALLCYYANGRAQSWTFKENIVSYELMADGTVVVLNGFVPDKLYDEERACLLFNDLVVHKDNGELERKEAPGKVLLLNDEQKKLLERLKEVLKEMKDANMRLLFDISDTELSVVNKPKGVNWYGWSEGGVRWKEVMPEEQVVKEFEMYDINEEFEIML